MDSQDSLVVVVGEVTYPIVRAKFKKFLALEQVRDHLLSAASFHDVDDLANTLCEYVSLSIGCSILDVGKWPWEITARAFIDATSVNTVWLNIPLFTHPTEKVNPEAWEYPGRSWYAYAHLIAKEYGWSMEYIADLEVADAFYLVQEILISHQLDREWQWDLSEKSIGYDEATKKSKYNPLPRPGWMSAPIQEPKKIKILKAHMPMGNVIRLDGSRVEYS